MGEGTKFANIAQNKLPPKSLVATIPGNFCHKSNPDLSQNQLTRKRSASFKDKE